MASLTTTVSLDEILCEYLKKVICEQNGLSPEDILSIKLDNGVIIVQLSGSVEKIDIKFTI